MIWRIYNEPSRRKPCLAGCETGNTEPVRSRVPIIPRRYTADFSQRVSRSEHYVLGNEVLSVDLQRQFEIPIPQRANTPESRMPTERFLIQQCLSGNQDAFRRLIEPHQDFVFRVAISVLGSREEAEEAAQDAFVGAYRGLGSFSGKVPFQAWMYRIAVRTALNVRRRTATAPARATDAARLVRWTGFAGDGSARRPVCETGRANSPAGDNRPFAGKTPRGCRVDLSAGTCLQGDCG